MFKAGMDAKCGIQECETLARSLTKNMNVDPSETNRIFGYYLPVFYWLRKSLEQLRCAKGPCETLVCGLSCPQVRWCMLYHVPCLFYYYASACIHTYGSH